MSAGTDPIPGGVPNFSDDAQPAPEPELGRVVMGYTIVRLLGAGAMGSVYEGEHRLGGRAALKILHQSINSNPELREQFERETRILFKLDNTHVVKAFGYEALPDGRQCLLMAFHENTPLDRVIANNGGSLALPIAISYAYQILDGLEAAHAAGVWHRDLKPSNVLELKESTQVDGVNYPLLKIVDFGIAHDSAPRALREASVEVVAEQVHAGTPDYLSPEQAARSASDGRSDLYSLGVMLFEMLSGRMPFEGATPIDILRHHRFTPAPRLGHLVDSLPEGLDPLVSQLLEKDPARRPQSATEVKRELAPDQGAAWRAHQPRLRPAGPGPDKVGADRACPEGERDRARRLEAHSGPAGGRGSPAFAPPPAVGLGRGGARAAGGVRWGVGDLLPAPGSPACRRGGRGPRGRATSRGGAAGRGCTAAGAGGGARTPGRARGLAQHQDRRAQRAQTPRPKPGTAARAHAGGRGGELCPRSSVEGRPGPGPPGSHQACRAEWVHGRIRAPRARARS